MEDFDNKLKKMMPSDFNQEEFLNAALNENNPRVLNFCSHLIDDERLLEKLYYATESSLGRAHILTKVKQPDSV